jgi:hypothetical protein
MSQAEKTYGKRFTAAMIGYVIVLPLALWLMNRIGDSNWRYALALLPLLPVLGGFGAYLAYVRQLDEMQRRIQFEAFAFSLGCTGIVTFTLGFLEIAGGPALGMIWVFPMIIAFWGIGGMIARRRYK